MPPRACPRTCGTVGDGGTTNTSPVAIAATTRLVRAALAYATKHRAKKGPVLKFVLDKLRTAQGLITSREITTAWVEARGLKADEATFVLIRKRIGACLTKLRVEGVIVGAG